MVMNYCSPLHGGRDNKILQQGAGYIYKKMYAPAFLAGQEELEAESGKAICAIVIEVKLFPGQEYRQVQVDHATDISEKARLIDFVDMMCNLRVSQTARRPTGFWNGVVNITIGPAQ
jgi:hypothetical protein